MGVGRSACGFGSGYNMNSEVIQDHAVVNAQNMAVIMGLAMPWAGYSFDYECSFFNGCEFEQTLTIIFPKPSCGILYTIFHMQSISPTLRGQICILWDNANSAEN